MSAEHSRRFSNMNMGYCPKATWHGLSTSADDKNIFDVNMNLTVAEINRDFKMRYLYFQCEKQEQEDNLQELVSMVNKAAEKATKQTVNAFERMMFNGREFTPKREPREEDINNTMDEQYCNDLNRTVAESQSDFTDDIIGNPAGDVAAEAVVMTSKDTDLGKVITIPTETKTVVMTTTDSDIGKVLNIQSETVVISSRGDDLITNTKETETVVLTTTENDLGQVITVPSVIEMSEEQPPIDPHLFYVLAQNGYEIQEGQETNPLSIVAIIPDSTHYAPPISSQTGEEDISLVALVPDSTHHAPPISCQDDDSTLTLKEITARERSKLIKRAQRQNIAFREKERIKGKEKMKDKRKDPVYREMERKRDRERRRLARLNNTALRDKERERDREYRRRVKTQDIQSKNSNDLDCNSLECFMKDMDEKCQLLINCKQDDSSEEIIYSFNGKSNFDDEIHSAAVIEHSDETDLIGHYGDSVLQSEIISGKHSNTNHHQHDQRTDLIGPYGNSVLQSDSDCRQTAMKNVLESTEITYIL